MAKGQQGGMAENIMRNAIPRAKPSYNMQRVSPGVYRDSSGSLVRSKDGLDPTVKRDLINKAYEASRDMPMGQGGADAPSKIAPTGGGKQPKIDWNGIKFLGPDSSVPSTQSSRQANSAADIASQLARQFTGNAPQQPSNMNDVINWIQQLTKQQPPMGANMGSSFADFLQSGRNITPAPRPNGRVPAELQQEMNGAISDFLRRR